MYRAYYATAYNKENIMKNSKGQWTNMLFGFVRIFEKLATSDYDGIMVAFDKGKKTFRHDMYTDYKAGRKPMPDELRSQIPLLHKYLELLNVKTFMIDNYEADDIIGTLAKKLSNLNIKTQVISSDKDLLQLIDNNITVSLTKKGLTDLENFDPAHLLEIYSLESSQMLDLKALIGDQSDNISGVKGIGEKTALKLLEKYGNLDEILANADSITGKAGELITAHKEDALLSRTLATIFLDVPLDFEMSALERKDYNEEALFTFYREMDFHSLIKNKVVTNSTSEEFKFEVIEDIFRLKNILADNSSLYIETDFDNYHQAEAIGFGLTNKNGNFYIPFELLELSIDFQLFLSDKTIRKNVYDYKKIHVMLKYRGFELEGVVFDLLLAAYLINPLFTKEDFTVICNHFNYSDLGYDQAVYGNNRRNIPDLELAKKHIAQKAYAIYSLKSLLENKIVENKQESLFHEIEIPLSRVLGDMEFAGIKLDLLELERQKSIYENEIQVLSEEIYQLAGKQFNINSTKQLGELLFVDLQLTTGKKNKTGYSTDSDTLEKLRDKHPIIEKLIEYRILAKLNSTYIEGLKNTVGKESKVHTIYKQALTQTGRLSSIEPNLQNIPIRTERGRKIRKFFIPEKPENLFLACDYSQIELRVLAHLADVEKLINAFRNDEDIHEKTAKEIFGDINSDLRQKAKAVNFGIIYGISSYGLSEDVGISPKEAKQFIEKYLEVYPEIKKYMDDIITFVKEHKYVKTVMNRKRYIPEIESSNFMIREFGKRTAMNAPIQGSAADIIKKAMVDIANELKIQKLRSKLLLQVHDELILEVEEKELSLVKEIVKTKMERVISLKVPLKVSIDIGKNWYEV